MIITLNIDEYTDLSKDHVIDLRPKEHWSDRLFRELDDSIDKIVQEAHSKLDQLAEQYLPIIFYQGIGITNQDFQRSEFQRSYAQSAEYLQAQRYRNNSMNQQAMAAQMAAAPGNYGGGSPRGIGAAGLNGLFGQ